jgi:PAS domain S-box-containing protein
VVADDKVLSLVDNLGGIVWVADPDTFQFSFVSTQAEAILGYPCRLWIDEPDFWRRHTHPDDVERCTRFCLDAARQGRDHKFEYRMIAADGRVVWLRDVVSVRNSPEGGRRLIGIALDITQEKAEEAEKHRIERLHEALLENSSDNITLLREDGVAVFQSAAIEQQFGYTRGEFVGRNNFELVHPDDRTVVQARFGEMLRSPGAVGPVRYRARHKSGGWRTFETVGKRFKTDEGNFVVLNTRDVTETIEAQRALESTREQLAHAMKMEAVGRLAGAIAHDFNNLLTVIAGYADLLGGTFEPDDKRLSDLEQVRGAAHRASLLTRQLLAFSRKQVLRSEVLDLNMVIRDVAKLIRRLIGEDVQLAIETAPAPLPILADRSQLEQVLMNLAVNARDAMPLGGRLHIRTERDDATARLLVTDTGTGMPPEVVGRAFEPFFTTKESGKGTGLGLSTVYGIVKQSGGDIHIESQVNAGTTFVVSLPVVQERAAPAPAVREERPRGTETILFVEDEKQVRELVSQVLTRLGYTVLVAPDGASALEIARERGAALDLLLTDVVMPHMSGPEVYSRVAALVPDIGVLYVSGYTGDAVLRHGITEEGMPFLQKPFTALALSRKVREVLDDRGGGHVAQAG